MKKILVTGGEGRFAKALKSLKTTYKFEFRDKKELNILSVNSIVRNLKKYKPDAVIHLAGFSRPMQQHEKKIIKSIDLNIIGTSNLVKECYKSNIKLIYLSSSYVYGGTKGNYSEEDGVNPWNNYGWSKLGGESAVQMYKNSLIIRACMTEKPFIHEKAFTNVKTNFIFHEDFAKIFIKIIKKKGVINIGGKSQSVYKFAKYFNKKIKKIKSNGSLPKRIDMNLSKLKKILRNAN